MSHGSCPECRARGIPWTKRGWLCKTLDQLLIERESSRGGCGRGEWSVIGARAQEGPTGEGRAGES